MEKDFGEKVAGEIGILWKAILLAHFPDYDKEV